VQSPDAVGHLLSHTRKTPASSVALKTELPEMALEASRPYDKEAKAYVSTYTHTDTQL